MRSSIPGPTAAWSLSGGRNDTAPRPPSAKKPVEAGRACAVPISASTSSRLRFIQEPSYGNSSRHVGRGVEDIQLAGGRVEAFVVDDVGVLADTHRDVDRHVRLRLEHDVDAHDLSERL